MKRLGAGLLVASLLWLSPAPVRAVTDPLQFSCQNPVGQIIASYSSGTHGIPGDSRTYTGSDMVYRIDENYVLQCFCPSDGSEGIQSNWWRMPDFSLETIEFFTKRGWVYVANGKLWGLAEAPYLVKNERYQCRASGGGGNGGSTSSQSSGDSGRGGQGETAGSAVSSGGIGRVLGVAELARTGSAGTILSFLALALFSFLIAWRLRRR